MVRSGGGSFDELRRVGRIVAYRPDDKEVDTIEGKSDGRSVRSSIWHGEGVSPYRGSLRNILDSSTLTVRFFTDRGSTLETTFNLKGAPLAISKALDIRANVAQGSP